MLNNRKDTVSLTFETKRYNGIHEYFYFTKYRKHKLGYNRWLGRVVQFIFPLIIPLIISCKNKNMYQKHTTKLLNDNIQSAIYVYVNDNTTP